MHRFDRYAPFQRLKPLRSFLVVVTLVLAGVIPGLGQASYDTSPNSQTGTQVYGSYFSPDIDSVNVYDGNIHLDIPLFTVPGRELPMTLALSYNSQKWEQNTCAGTPCGNYTGGWRKITPYGDTPTFFEQYLGCGNPFPGYPYIWEAQYGMTVYWVDGNGTKHTYMQKVFDPTSQTWAQIPYCPNSTPPAWDNRTLPSLDSDGSVVYTGTYMSTDTSPAFIAFKDGSRRYIRDANVSYDLVTPNGNYLVKATNGLPTQDTLGRTAQYTTDGTSTESYKITDANGVLQTYQINYQSLSVYDPWQQTYVARPYYITSIVLPNGKSYQFQYNHPQGFLTKLILPSGAYISYAYYYHGYNYTGGQPNDDFVVARHVSADGTAGSEKTWQYLNKVLGGGSQLIKLVSPEGDYSQHQFNAQGLETATWWYSSTSVLLNSTSSSWSQVEIEANAQPNTPQTNSVTTALDNGSVQSTRTITYDSNMNVTQDKVTDWSTASILSQKDFTYTTISTPIVSNSTRPSTETLTAIDPVSGNFIQQGLTQYFYDEYSFTYTRTGVPNSTGNTSSANLGNLTTVKRFKDGTNFVADHTYYDNVGNVVQRVDPLSNTTTFDYTDNFSDSTNRNTFAYLKTQSDPLSHTVMNQYNFATGLKTQTTNERGLNTAMTYDLMNRPTSITEPNTKVTAYSYDDTNRITTKTVTVDSSGYEGVATYFDGLYRVLQTRTNDPEGQIAVDTVYDGKGRRKQFSNPYRVTGGTQIWTSTTYDGLDRTTQVQAPDGSTVQYGFSNNQRTVTDEAGNGRRYTYNVLGQMTQVEEPNPTLATPLATTYGYYVFGPLASSNQSGQTRAFANNWLGQMTGQTLPESGTTTFVYDAASRLTSKTDARPVTTSYTYDNANRLTGKTYVDSTQNVSFGYDGTISGITYTGLKTSMTDALGSVSYTYDNMNRLTQEQRTMSGVTGAFSTGYSYNIKGDLTSMTYPSGRVVNFSYAVSSGVANSRLASVVDQTTGTTMNWMMNYNAAGKPLNETLGNSVVQTFAYNNRLQETSTLGTLGSTALMNFSYDYGTSATDTGRVLSRTDNVQPEHSATYIYDSIYRLGEVASKDVSNSWGIAWTFDVFGNRLTQAPLGLASSKIGTQTLGYTNNRNTAFTYDAAGNETNDGIHSYIFSAENQILTMDGGAVTYAYDGEGRRMKKLTASETTYTFYGRGGIISEFTTSTALDTAPAALSTDIVFYHTTDRLGSAVLVMNATGFVIENNRTLPYGEAWLAADFAAASTNDKKFETYQRDSESGLDYAMARFDQSTMGKFQSSDPDDKSADPKQPVTLNRYLYVKDDPINFSDPTGKCYEPWGQYIPDDDLGPCYVLNVISVPSTVCPDGILYTSPNGDECDGGGPPNWPTTPTPTTPPPSQNPGGSGSGGTSIGQTPPAPPSAVGLGTCVVGQIIDNNLNKSEGTVTLVVGIGLILGQRGAPALAGAFAPGPGWVFTATAAVWTTYQVMEAVAQCKFKNQLGKSLSPLQN